MEISKTVHPVHFESLSGQEFERLAFAYLLRIYFWLSGPEWYGQAGGDKGRDIVGIIDDDTEQGIAICVQCANHRDLNKSKLTQDFAKLQLAPGRQPDKVLFIAGGKISATVRDEIKTLSEKQGIQINAWSGSEFEEKLRLNGESLLKRFFSGEDFPDTPDTLRSFVDALTPDDTEILALMATVFDRPAFFTPFHHESHIPSFREAIGDTIAVLSTGVHRHRNGTEIKRIPSRHQLKDPALRKAVAAIEKKLAKLRSILEDLIRQGLIKPYGPPGFEATYEISDFAATRMDDVRSEILSDFRKLYPDFEIAVGW
jgi:hypothetical protein